MLAAQLLAALLAMAAMDVELTHDRPTRNLGLKLVSALLLDEVSPAVGTVLRQGRVEDFIDLSRRRRLAMAMPSVLLARLAARLLGVLFRLALGERSGWSFGGAFRFVEPLLQRADGLLEHRDVLTQLLIFQNQLLIRRRVHANLDSDVARQLYAIIGIGRRPGKLTLNKHHFTLVQGPGHGNLSLSPVALRTTGNTAGCTPGDLPCS